MTPDQFKQALRQRGETITQWSANHGFNRHAVYRVLNGFDKAHYGQAHQIAVAIGMKPGPSTAPVVERRAA